MRREKTQNTHTRTNAGGGSVAERWGAGATVVRVGADQRARRPGAGLISVLAPTGGGGSSSLAYVSRLLPALLLGQRARVMGTRSEYADGARSSAEDLIPSRCLSLFLLRRRCPII